MNSKKGKLVVFEGGPGSGKTTQINLLKEKLGWEMLREPGGTEYGEAVREILQERHELLIDKTASVFGYMTCRANLIFTKVIPWLEEGKNILLDRYWFSTYAYQGSEGFDKNKILTLAEMATGGLMPDLVIYYDMDAAKGQARKNHNQQRQDRYDVKDLEFFDKARKNYLELGKMYPEIWRTIDASGTIEEVHAMTIKAMEEKGII